MKIDWRAVQAGVAGRRNVVGAAAVLTIASIVYSQFDLYGHLSRDSAIYIYGGQRLTHGVPPYASIMDPKGPLSGILCGFGVAIARLLGRDDVLIIRVEFCALAIISVLGIYLLVLEMWHSVVAAVVAGAVFVSFRSYAHQALMGPEGHAPGVVFLIFAMWLTVSRRWYWAGVAASLAFCSWQPLFTYPIVVVVCALVWTAGHRLRAVGWTLAGIATPLVALMVYYALEGYLGSLFTGLFVFPLTSVRRTPESEATRFAFIVRNIDNAFQSSAVFLWLGLALMLVMAAHTVFAARPRWHSALASPMILLVLLSFGLHLFYVAYDYIGWTHAFPLLPYAAIGFGAATAYVLDRLAQPRTQRIVTAALSAGVAALTVVYAIVYYEPSTNDAAFANRTCPRQGHRASRRRGDGVRAPRGDRSRYAPGCARRSRAARSAAPGQSGQLSVRGQRSGCVAGRAHARRFRRLDLADTGEPSVSDRPGRLERSVPEADAALLEHTRLPPRLRRHVPRIRHDRGARSDAQQFDQARREAVLLAHHHGRWDVPDHALHLDQRRLTAPRIVCRSAGASWIHQRLPLTSSS